MKVKFKLLEGAILPTFATKGSSGFDLVAHNFKKTTHILDNSMVDAEPSKIEQSIRIKPHGRLLVGTGLFTSMEPGFEIQIRSRSGLALNKGLIVLNEPGTIDSDYRHEIGVILYNSSLFEVEVKLGDRIAQGVVCSVVNKWNATFQVVENLDEDTDRKGGFGSTGT